MGRLWLAAVVAALSAACTNNPYPSSDQAKKIYYTSFVEAPKTLDPAVAYTTTEHEITGPVYESLLEYHYLKRPYELIPGLATHVPKAVTLADGRVKYVFELRPGMLFQEDPAFSLAGAGGRSREITAQDFVFELMRIADPAVNSPVVEPFSNLEGFAEFSEKLGKRRKQDAAFTKLRADEQYAALGGFSGARVIDGTHFEITLAKAYPQILFWFAMPFTTPVPWEAIQHYDGKDGREQFADHPVGCGPFKLTHYHKQSRMVLQRNDNWYGIRHRDWHAPGATFPSEGEPDDAALGRLKSAGKSLPFIERVEFRREKEKIPAFNKFLQGYYDASGVIRESFDRVIRDDRLSPEMQKLGMKLDKSVVASVFYIGFNMDDPVVGSKGGERNRKLRQAMSLAVDVKEYTRLFMNGRGVPAQTPLPPGLFGYEEAYKNPFRVVDLERAKRLLAEAGFENGVDPKTGKPLHLTFDIPDTSAEGRPRFQFHVNQWRKIGIDVELAATNYNKFQQKVRDGAYQIFQWGWVADYPDAENFMFLLWSEMSRRKNNGPNTANFSNPEFDRLFLQMKARDNDEQRMDMLRKMRDIITVERPWIELFHLEDYALYHGWYKNVKPAGLSIPTLKYHDLDPVLRQEKRELWNKPVLWPAYLIALFLAIVIAPGIRTYLRERQ